MADPFARHGSAALMPFRRKPPRLSPGSRRYEQMMAEIDVLDTELERIIARRRAVANELSDLVEVTWPKMNELMGYHAPRADELPMPDIAPDAERLIGGSLRAVAVTLLGKYGECPLRTLHCLLITHGFVIASRRPVKALADALALEVHHARVVRVRRGVYAPHPGFQPRRGCIGDVPLVPATPWTPARSAPNDLRSAAA